jgi:hypothetical protein
MAGAIDSGKIVCVANMLMMPPDLHFMRNG